MSSHQKQKRSRKRKNRLDDGDSSEYGEKIDETEHRIEFLKSELSSMLEGSSNKTPSTSSASKNDLSVIETLVKKGTKNNPNRIFSYRKSRENTMKSWRNPKWDPPMVSYKSNKDSVNYKSMGCSSTSRYPNMSLLPEHKVERLLFKSFLLKMFDNYIPSSDESDVEKSNTKKQNYKKPKRTKAKQNESPWVRPKRAKISRRQVISPSSESDIEIVDLDSDYSRIQNSYSDDLGFDIEIYDWNEPFDLNTKTDSNESVINVSMDTTIEEPKQSTTINIDESYVSDKLTSKATNILPSAKTSAKKSTPTATRKSPGGGAKQVKEKKVWECPICYEESTGQEIVATACGHVFCKVCLEIHQKIRQTCPSCVSDLTDKPLITLYNV